MSPHTPTEPTEYTPQPKRSFWADSSAQSAFTGLMVCLVKWAGPAVLVFPVAKAAGLNDEIAMSWLWSTTIFTSIVSITMSLATRTPVISTWSTPALAFLLTALPGTPFAEAVGAFIIAGVLTVLIGTIQPLARLVNSIPEHLAAALNAAILLPFGFAIATSGMEAPMLVAIMVTAYLVMRRIAARWAIACVLIAGVVATTVFSMWGSGTVNFALTTPTFVMPEFTASSTVSLAIPIVVLTLTGQIVPGFGVMRVYGYTPPPSRIIQVCGVASIGSALFGNHSVTLGALVANMTAGPEAHPDPARRYTAAVWTGVLNIGFAMFAGTFLSVMLLLPGAAVATLAGLALLGAIGSSLANAFATNTASLGAPVVLLVALSGIEPFGVGAAFWGIVAGLIVTWAERVGTPGEHASDAADTA